MFAAAATVFALTVSVPPVSAPPPPMLAPVTRPDAQLVAWSAEDISCGQQSVTAQILAAVQPTIGRIYGPGPQPVTLSFAIDASGRPHAIQDNDALFTRDLAPALAASRFAAGAARSGCTIRFAPARYSMKDAPFDLLVASSIRRSGDAPPAEGWARITGTGNCADSPRPQIRLRAFPDFATIPATPGQMQWALVAFDLNRNGAPAAAKIAASSGHGELNRAAVDAVAASRFSPVTRIGCAYPYHRAPGTVAAPPMPTADTFRPANATCPAKLDWARAPAPGFPENYRRRAIEGWAILSFDVAPWGSVGNVKVLASEPAAGFGVRARQSLNGASLAPSATGASGCVERFRFSMGADASGDDEAPNP